MATLEEVAAGVVAIDAATIEQRLAELAEEEKMLRVLLKMKGGKPARRKRKTPPPVEDK